MTFEARRAYAAVELQTAPPPRLRLMLIDAAIAAADEAQSHAAAARWAVAGEAFVRSRRAMAELLVSVRDDVTGEAADLARRVRALYAFLFRELTEAQLYRDPRRLEGALRILHMERDTWRQACQTAGAAPESRRDIDRPPAKA